MTMDWLLVLLRSKLDAFVRDLLSSSDLLSFSVNALTFSFKLDRVSADILVSVLAEERADLREASDLRKESLFSSAARAFDLTNSNSNSSFLLDLDRESEESDAERQRA